MKNNKGLIVVIVVLGVIVLGLVGYICYDKLSSNNLSKEEKLSNKVDSDELDDIKEKVKDINNLAEYFPIKDVNKINNQKLLNIAMGWRSKVVDVPKFDDFSAKELDDAVSFVLGDKVKLKHENIICDMDKDVLFIYNKELEEYKYNENHGGHGGTGTVSVKDYYVSSEAIGNKIIVKYKLLYSYCDDICVVDSYYKSASDAKNRKDPVIEIDYDGYGDAPEITSDMYERVKDKLPVVTYTFEKNNSKYNLESVKID